jgi:hypothetical protein
MLAADWTLYPSTLTQEQFDSLIANVLSVWAEATADQKTRGRQWYAVAHQLAGEIADTPRMGAGILAALSAQASWRRNVALAVGACTGRPVASTHDRLSKVERILSGEDPESVLPMDLKTGQFFRCILDPADATAIVIDRHAHDIAVGRRLGTAERGLTGRRYQLFADVYRKAARLLGETPQTVQAVTWVVWTEKRVS